MSHEKSRKTYGTRRIVEDLVEDDEVISRERVGRLMKEQGLESRSKRKDCGKNKLSQTTCLNALLRCCSSGYIVPAMRASLRLEGRH